MRYFYRFVRQPELHLFEFVRPFSLLFGWFLVVLSAGALANQSPPHSKESTQKPVKSIDSLPCCCVLSVCIAAQFELFAYPFSGAWSVMRETGVFVSMVWHKDNNVLVVHVFFMLYITTSTIGIDVSVCHTHTKCTRAAEGKCLHVHHVDDDDNDDDSDLACNFSKVHIMHARLTPKKSRNVSAGVGNATPRSISEWHKRGKQTPQKGCVQLDGFMYKRRAENISNHISNLSKRMTCVGHVRQKHNAAAAVLWPLYV